MKLIEKLSKEYAGPRPRCVGASFKLTAEAHAELDVVEAAYEAGFRTAREMASQEIRVIRLAPDTFPIDLYHAVTYESNRAAEKSEQAILAIGEQEI